MEICQNLRRHSFFYFYSLPLLKVWGIMLYPPFKNLCSSVCTSVCLSGPTLRYLGVIFASKIWFIPLRLHQLASNTTFLAHKTLWINNIGSQDYNRFRLFWKYAEIGYFGRLKLFPLHSLTRVHFSLFSQNNGLLNIYM